MTQSFSRRELIKWAGAGAGAAAVGGGVWLVGRDDHSGLAGTGDASSPTAMSGGGQANQNDVDASASSPPSSIPSSAAMADVAAVAASGDIGGRMLVVVELDGGNDGHSTLVPYGRGEYYDARTRTAVGEADVIHLSDTVGLHKNLSKINRRGVAIVQGLGSPQPDESHFEMLARWWGGDPASSTSFGTGFLGRLADAVGDPAAAAVAVSIGSASHPSMISAKAATLCLNNPDAFDYLIGADPEDVLGTAFQRGYAEFANGAAQDPFQARLRAVKGQSLAFAQALGLISDEGDDDGDDDEEGYPGSELGQGLRLAAQLLDAQLGVRIVHVPMQEDFDTHDDHSGRHPGLLQSLDDSLDAFLADLDRRGLADRVLVMTTSEFGRTLRDNGSSGLDHGTASAGLLLGPVQAGLYGEFPSLTKLSEDDEPIATVSFDQYYATVAEAWFGVPAGDVLHGNVAPLTDIFR
jgi:uncharacterized protein (DUF1501 family)